MSRNRLMAPRDAARRVKLPTSRVVQLDREGQLPAMRDSSGRRFYYPDRVEQFARERELAREGNRSGSEPADQTDGTAAR